MGASESQEEEPQESNGYGEVGRGHPPSFVAMPTAQQGWAHAVGSKTDLVEALENKAITAIEADIIMGGLIGGEADTAIMAHPPARDSDLSFKHFFKACVDDGRRHIKLDFKEFAALDHCLPIVAAASAHLHQNGQVVWLNADILPGPGRRGVACAVPADDFLSAVLAHCPGVPLSLGWRCFPSAIGDRYTEADCAEMLRVYKSYMRRLDGKDGGVVFAVSLRLAAKSVDALTGLLKALPNSQLLFWTGVGERAVPLSTKQQVEESFTRAGFGDRIGFDCQVATSLLAVKNELEMCVGGVLNCMGLM